MSAEICTSDDIGYQPPGYKWTLSVGDNILSCTLLEVTYDKEYTTICDVVVNGHLYPKEQFKDGQTYFYDDFNITCYGWIEAESEDQKADIRICAPAEATDILTLYFKPWSWVNIDSAVTKLVDKTTDIAGELSNVFSDVSGYEYVSHEIVVEKPDFGSSNLIGIRIYLISSEESQPLVAWFIPVILVLAVFLAAIGPYVAYKIADIYNVYVDEYPALVNEYVDVYGEYNKLYLENEYQKVKLNESTPNDYIIAVEMKKQMLEESYKFTPRNDRKPLDDLISKFDESIEQYRKDDDFDKLYNRNNNDIEDHNKEREEETRKNYEPGERIDLKNEGWFNYLTYGGMALGGILLAALGIKLIDTIKR